MVVNTTSTNPARAIMAPSTEVVDLTADSDEDGPITSSRPLRPNGHTASSPGRKSGARHLRSPESAATTRGSQSNFRPAASDPLSPVTTTSKPATNYSRHVTGPKFKAQTTGASQSSQQPHSVQSGQKNQSHSNSMRSMNKGPQKGSPILLDSDNSEDESTPSKHFKEPRGLEHMNLRHPTPSNRSIGSVFDATANGRSKRSLEDDSQSSNSLPSKRQKTTQTSDDRGSAFGSGNTSRDVPETNGKSEQNGLKASSQPLDRQNDTVEASKSEAPNPKRPRERPPTSDSLEADNLSSRSQRDTQKPGSSNLLGQSHTRPNEPNDVDEDAHGPGGSGNQLPKRDTTPRIRKETPKGQALSASRKSKSHSGGDAHNHSGQDQGSDSRFSNQSKSSSIASDSLGTPTQRKKVHDPAQADKAASAKQTQRKPFNKEKSSEDDDVNEGQLPSIAANVATGAGLTSKKSGHSSVNDLEKSTTNGTSTGVRTREEDTDHVNPESQTANHLGSSAASEAGTSPMRTRRSDKTSSRNSNTDTQGTGSISGQKSPEPRTDPKMPSEAAVLALSSGSDTAGKQATALADEADLQLRSEAMKDVDQPPVTNDARPSFARPTLAASAMRPSSSYSRELPLATQVEKMLGKYLEELGDDNEYWTSVSMNRARLAREQESFEREGPDQNPQEDRPTSFAKLKSPGLSPHQKGNSSSKSDQLWGIEKTSATGRAAGPTWLSGTYKTFESDVADVPNYAHYVSIKNNILAPNVPKLICWPYFGDDFDVAVEATNLDEQYYLDIGERERKLLLLLKAYKYKEYVESALEDLGCSWSDVLRFLLEPRPDVGSALDAQKVLDNRHEFCEHDFSRISERWRSILTELPPSTPEKLALAALLCDNFQKLAKFSLWHVARMSECAKLPEEAEIEEKVQLSDNELTCRICLRFNCPYHGELKESADSDSDDESGTAADSVIATDIVHPPKVNYRTRVAIPPSHAATTDVNKASMSRGDKKEPRFWRNNDFNHLPDERGPFYPCHHPETSCVDARCSCFENKLPCEKICSCAPDCNRKFQGCSCSTERIRKGTKGPCFEDERCACYQSGRECDPDLCGGCGACEVVDPVNKHDDSILHGRCRNCSIQRGLPKQTLLGDSGVHGLGLYACEEIREHDFVGEYKGEIITKEEAERRGAVYEHQKLSYLFSLNATQEIDSTNFGNKVRFINHAKDRANMYPRIIMVNTVHRIALYASRLIKPGQELLFDYGPKFPDEQLGGKKSKKSAPHVRNAALVRNFVEVEESEDEVGNVRAKGVSHATSAKNKARRRKARGDARSNAGGKSRVEKSSAETASASANTTQDAAQRLAAYNISDEARSDLMDVDVEPGADEDDEYEESESEESYNSEDSERSDFGAEDDEDDDGSTLGTNRPNRGGVATRRKGDRKWL